jgi:hypothetical protein
MIVPIGEKNIDDPLVPALAALGWIVADPARCERMLAMTGLTPADLRERVADPQLLAAILAFMEAHEPDLIACSEATGITPEQFVRAHMELER